MHEFTSWNKSLLRKLLMSQIRSWHDPNMKSFSLLDLFRIIDIILNHKRMWLQLIQILKCVLHFNNLPNLTPKFSTLLIKNKQQQKHIYYKSLKAFYVFLRKILSVDQICVSMYYLENLNLGPEHWHKW